MKKINRKFNYEWNMYYGADISTRMKAKKLRKEMTEPEMLLWECLRNRKTGFKFRRQHPIGIYIADFYCHELKLVVEVDGEIHNARDQIEWDNYRTMNMHLMNITVIRFSNEDVQNHMEKVLAKVKGVCNRIFSS